MSKQQISKNQVKVRLAATDQLLAKLEADFQATTYRHNLLVAGSIKSGRNELEQAYEALFEEDFAGAYKLCAVSWLHLDFGRQLLDAETIEHLLGQSDYLELTESEIPWESRAKQYLAVLEAAVLNLRDQIGRAKQDL